MKDMADRLAEVLREASEHLDYCGYGDSWERECAGDLPTRIETILEQYQSRFRKGEQCLKT